MLLDPDRLLLEHVFQRTTRLLSGRWSCYDLARGCLPGVVVFSMCLGAECVRAMGAGWMPFAVFLVLLMLVGTAQSRYRINRMERNAACGRLVDPHTSSERVDRYLYLATVVWSFLGETRLDPAIHFAGPMFLAWMCAKYFMMCTPHTPSRQSEDLRLLGARTSA